MNNKYPHLFSPIKIGNLTMKNRIFAAPNGQVSMNQFGHLDSDTIAFWTMKAEGGAAVVTLGECTVETKTGKSDVRHILLDDEHNLPYLSRAARAIAHRGAVPSVELSHGGSYGSPVTLPDGRTVVYGASNGCPGKPGYEIVEMPKEMIKEIADAHGKAAYLAKSAGFQMIMVHAAHGWLLSQFLSPLFNQRTDEFGGSLENRARFLVMCLESVRKYVGNSMPIELRFNGSDFTEGGFTLEEAVEVAKMVEDKVDLFHLSCGTILNSSFMVRTHPSQFMEDGCNVFLAEEIKKHVSKPVAAVGGLWNPEYMEDLIASGKVDVVEIGRSLVADPFLPKKLACGQEDDVTPCIRCMECLVSGQPGNNMVIKCSVNPVVGNELEVKMNNTPPEKIKRVLVIGGGPGGMQAAIAAADRGHDVTLVEKSDRTGGSLWIAGEAAFKKRLQRLATVLDRRMRNKGVTVLLNTEATSEWVTDFAPDAIIAAVGAEPVIPPIPGIECPCVLTVEQAEDESLVFGDRVVVVGGGLVGTELAISLCQRGKEVSIIEMTDQIISEADTFWTKPVMNEEIKKYQIHVFENTKVTAMDCHGVVCTDIKGNKFRVSADNVVVCTGYKARTDVTEQLRNLAPEFYAIGDCTRPGRVINATEAGFFAGFYL